MYILKIKETQCVLNDSFDFRTLFIEIFHNDGLQYLNVDFEGGFWSLNICVNVQMLIICYTLCQVSASPTFGSIFR